MMHSRHLGALVFCEEGDESVVDACVALDGTATAATLVVARPADFDRSALDSLDAQLDQLGQLAANARSAIAAQVEVPESPVAQLWEFYRDEVEGWSQRTAEEFASALQPVKVAVFPDGAWSTTSVIGIDYAIADAVTDQLIAVRFPDGSTPHLTWES